jgi:hypothetical protein
MAELPADIAIGFDMHGCPNRCRHCWLSALGNDGINEDTVRRITGDFRTFVREGHQQPHFRKVWVSTEIREPDVADDYRRLHALSAELSDGPVWRYELLSVWRLARDPSYAGWAKSVGPDTCQITFFGGQQTTDWFCRRAGAFDDAMLATQQLLEAGMKPRWQIFANTMGLPELSGLLRLIDRLRLRERVASLGAEFVAFIHLWGPCANTLGIEQLRPTVADLQTAPLDLLESTRRHRGQDVPWRSEGELCQAILDRPPLYGYGMEPGHMAWFLVSADLDVYFNAYDVAPAFCLGNLAAEPLSVVLGRFEQDDAPGLRAIAQVSAQEQVRRFGDPSGRKAFCCENDLLQLYLARHWAANGAGQLRD